MFIFIPPLAEVFPSWEDTLLYESPKVQTQGPMQMQMLKKKIHGKTEINVDDTKQMVD